MSKDLILKCCADLGVKVESLYWEPISPCGYSGGWILNGKTQLGLTVKESLEYLLKENSNFFLETLDDYVEEEDV